MKKTKLMLTAVALAMTEELKSAQGASKKAGGVIKRASRLSTYPSTLS